VVYNCNQTTNYYTDIYVHIEAASVITGATVDGRGVGTSVVRRYVLSGIKYQVVKIGSRRLFYNDRAEYTLNYKILGGEPRSKEASRVGAAYTYFCPSGNGDSGGSVTVRFPAGYTEINALGNGYTRTDSTGGSVFETGQVDNAFQLFACIEAVNPSLYSSDSFTSKMGTRIELRAWPNDNSWMANAKQSLPRVVDALEAFTGVPISNDMAITIRESSTTGELGGYAGTYEQRIARVSESFDTSTAAHELAHVWFNDKNIEDNWAFEGLAEFTAQRSMAALNLNIGKNPCSETYAYNYTTLPKSYAKPGLLEWEFLAAGDSARQDTALSNRIDMRYRQACAAIADYLYSQPQGEVQRAIQAIIAGTSPATAEHGKILSTHDILDILAMATQDLDGVDAGIKASNDWGFAPLTSAEQPVLADRAAALNIYGPIWLGFVEAGWSTPVNFANLVEQWDFTTLKSEIESARAGYSEAGLPGNEISIEYAPVWVNDHLSAAGYTPGAALREAFRPASTPEKIGASLRNLVDASTLILLSHEALLVGVDPITAIGGVVLNVQGSLDDAASAALIGDAATALSKAKSVEGSIPNRTLAGVLAILALAGVVLLLRKRRKEVDAVLNHARKRFFSAMGPVRMRVMKLAKRK
jgi:hypothetical protein